MLQFSLVLWARSFPSTLRRLQSFSPPHGSLAERESTSCRKRTTQLLFQPIRSQSARPRRFRGRDDSACRICEDRSSWRRDTCSTRRGGVRMLAGPTPGGTIAADLWSCRAAWSVADSVRDDSAQSGRMQSLARAAQARRRRVSQDLHSLGQLYFYQQPQSPTSLDRPNALPARDRARTAVGTRAATSCSPPHSREEAQSPSFHTHTHTHTHAHTRTHEWRWPERSWRGRAAQGGR